MKNKNHMILVWSHQKHRPASVSLSSLDAGSSFFFFFLQESNSADKVQLTINVSRQVVHHWPRLTCFNVEHHLCVCVCGPNTNVMTLHISTATSTLYQLNFRLRDVPTLVRYISNITFLYFLLSCMYVMAAWRSSTWSCRQRGDKFALTTIIH